MAVVTVRGTSHISCNWGCPSESVLDAGHWFEVIRIYAMAPPTQVVNNKSLWNWANK
jgi:hypothetical protein